MCKRATLSFPTANLSSFVMVFLLLFAGGCMVRPPIHWVLGICQTSTSQVRKLQVTLSIQICTPLVIEARPGSLLQAFDLTECARTPRHWCGALTFHAQCCSCCAQTSSIIGGWKERVIQDTAGTYHKYIV